MTDRPSDIIKSRVYTPEQVDYIVFAKGREGASFLANKFGTSRDSVSKIWQRASAAGLIGERKRIADCHPNISRPQPSMPRLAWLERPMPSSRI